MADPKTIDNLGVNVSIDWARRQEEEKGIPLQEGQRISAQTIVDVTSPSYIPEVLILIGQMREFQPLACFAPPLNYTVEKGGIFTDLICPSLGSDEKKEEQMGRIKQLVPSLAEGKKPSSMEQEEQIKEKNILTALLDFNLQYDKYSSEVYSRKNQYQRG